MTQDHSLRPLYHFTPERGWMNDPNGLVYHAGEYHLFFQHNPDGTDWISDLSWGHAVSTDLLAWKQLPEAIPPTPYDGGKVAGSWSGSAAVDWTNTAGFQQGDEKAIVAAWTAVGFGQCIAFSGDRGRTFTKWAGNPAIPYPASGESRDPRILRHRESGNWIMALWEGAHNGISFYGSPDLKRWNYLSSVPGFFECPDFYELPIDGQAARKRWVLQDASGKYLVGTFDGAAFRPETEPQMLDAGANYYAGQTWSDVPVEHARRLSIAWMRDDHFPAAPFKQQMGVVSELTLRALPEGLRVCKQPAHEIDRLHAEKREQRNFTLRPGVDALEAMSGEAFDIRLALESGVDGAIELMAAGESIRCAGGEIACMGRSMPLPERAYGRRLRVLVDRLSIEVFGNDGEVSMTQAVHPAEAGSRLSLKAPDGAVRIAGLTASRMRRPGERG